MKWLLRRWLARRGDDGPARLIDLPGQLREPSSDLLRRLREIDARAEVVYVGQGRWWVGRVKAAPHRRARGRAIVRAVQEGDGFGGDRSAELRQGLLMAQGFGLVVDMTVQGEPDAALVHEFEMAMFVERGGVLETDEERESEQARRARIREGNARDRDLIRRFYRRGLPGREHAWVSGYTGRRSA